MFNSFSTKSPPFHVSLDDISPSPERRGRPDVGISTRLWPGRRSRGHIRHPLGRTSHPFMGTRTRPTTPPASHPPLLVGHPFETPPVQPPIPTDAHRGRSPRTSADSERTISRSRVQPLPAHSLASTLQLYYPLRRGTHQVQSPRRSRWWLGKVAHRASTNNSANSYIVRFLDDPGPNQGRPPAIHFTERRPQILVSSASSGRGISSRCPTEC